VNLSQVLGMGFPIRKGVKLSRNVATTRLRVRTPKPTTFFRKYLQFCFLSLIKVENLADFNYGIGFRSTLLDCWFFGGGLA
jgi:hypothetical protein